MKRLREAAEIKYIDKKYDPANAPKADKPVAAKPSKDAQAEANQQKENSVNKGLNGL